MKSKICEILDIEFPLLAFSHCKDVVAQVSKAGGMGVLGAVGMTPEILEQELPKYLHHIKNKNSEEAKKQYSISSLFEKIFGVASEDLDFEVPTKTASKLKGRADTLFQNIIFEWKKDAKNSKAITDGEIELKK